MSGSDKKSNAKSDDTRGPGKTNSNFTSANISQETGRQAQLSTLASPSSPIVGTTSSIKVSEKNTVIEKSQMPVEAGEDAEHKQTASTNRLLDRINKQKDKLAEEQAQHAAEQAIGAIQKPQPSELMEQAWQHVDSNVKKLTRTEGMALTDKPRNPNFYSAPGTAVEKTATVAWNSQPDQIGGGQIAIRQQTLAQQLPYNQSLEPPQIPGPEKSLNHYISENQNPNSIADSLWDDENDPVFTQTSQVSEQIKPNSGNRLLGLGITLAIISVGLYYIVGKAEPIVSEFYKLQQAAKNPDIVKATATEAPKDLAQQTISSQYSEKDNAESKSSEANLQLQVHDSAIKEKMRPEFSSLSERLENKNSGEFAKQSEENRSGTADIAEILVSGITGPAGRVLPIRLGLTSGIINGDGSVVFRGIPEEVMLSTGTRKNRTWMVPISELTGLTLISDPEFQGPFDVDIELRDHKNSVKASNSMTVDIEPFQPGTNENNDRNLVAASETEKQTQNLIRGTSIIGAEENSSGQSEVKSLANESQSSIQQTISRLSPSSKANLLARGQQLLRDGDIASARLAFEHLANNGNAAGAYALAQTYDPQWMTLKAVRGVQGDINEAVRWYKVAVGLGQDKAASRIRDLELEVR